jgi:tetratricopeptide (TPR) repeat protein
MTIEPTSSLFRQQPARRLLSALVLLAGLLGSAPGFAAERSLSPPADPRQSINYWKAHSISAEQDPLVKKSESIFSVLLRGWDNSRLEPGLYVVESSSGAWAASLEDGNILLSRDAINTCMSFGEERGEHLLAFVLAHELAHQRADDLWHQRFFRMIGDHSPETREKMLHGLELDNALLSDLEQKEAQADHDGLILMASVGFDPHQILDDDKTKARDFFTSWVENIWQQSCAAEQDTSLKDACQQAQARALRTRAQLETVATQALVYELGVQAFVAGNYPLARQYFTAYGRDYPSRAVLSALGLSYLAEAQNLHTQLLELGAVQQAAFYYPLMLDTRADAQPQNDNKTQSQKRSEHDALVNQLKKQKHVALEQAIALFEKAIRLEPMHNKSYVLLATAHLLDNNSFMVRGVLQGSYAPRFGEDAAVDMMLALTTAIEGNTAAAAKALDSLVAELDKGVRSNAMPENLLYYSVYFNSAALASFKGDTEKAQSLWKQLASTAKSSGNTLLFRMALGQLLNKNTRNASLSSAPSIRGKRIGDKINTSELNPLTDLWIEGEQFRVYRKTDGSRYITTENREIISAWQDMGDDSLAGVLAAGDSADRPFKTLGMPDRRINLQSGEYLAYDRYGLALHINNDRITGWFLYTN